MNQFSPLKASYSGEAFHSLNLGITTCYLLPCKPLAGKPLPKRSGYLLNDTGFPSDYRKFFRALDKIEVEPEQIRYLLMINNHDDHVGLAARLRRESGARLIIHRAAVEALKRGVMDHSGIRSLNGLIALCGFLHSIFTARNCRFEPVVTEDVDFMVEGDDPALLRRIGIDAEILYTPGTAVTLSP